MIYLGASESTAFPMPGRVMVEKIEMEPGRIVTRRSLTDAGGEDIAHDDFTQFLGVDAGAR